MNNYTQFQDIYNSFLSKITSYDYLKLTGEELNMEFMQLLKTSLSKFRKKKDIKPNYQIEEFNRELEDIEIEILALGMVCAWLLPKINNVELIKQRLSSNDWKMYSQANHIGALLDMKKSCDTDFDSMHREYGLEQFKKAMGIQL